MAYFVGYVFPRYNLCGNMGGETEVARKQFTLEEILTEKQVHGIVKEYVFEDQWQVLGCEIQHASAGIAGFLGNHLKAKLQVKVGDCVREIQLFIKRMPFENKPKSEFIEKNNFYRREMIMFKLFEQFHATDNPNPWCPKALFCDDKILVMPDLNVEGYSPRPQQLYLDLDHVLVVTASLARFHAFFANFETKKTLDNNRPYTFLQDYGDVLAESTFQDSPWLHAAAKLTANFLNTFSLKYKNLIPNLEEKLLKLYIKACELLIDYNNTLNVVIHKDLWVNNIMFRYKNGAPCNALLIDFQCIRYGPPAFDFMTLLYLTTSRIFREQHEKNIIHYYYSVFYESLDDSSKERMKELNYDRQDFLLWCDKSRMFGLVEAICIFPYVLMDPVAAQKTYDDPETYEKYLVEDRTEPVVAHSHKCTVYRERQLEVAEEFVERYVLNQP